MLQPTQVFRKQGKQDEIAKNPKTPGRPFRTINKQHIGIEYKPNLNKIGKSGKLKWSV